MDERSRIREIANRAAERRALFGDERERIDRNHRLDAAITAGALLVLSLALIRGTPAGSACTAEPFARGTAPHTPIAIERDSALRLGIDPNTAGWPELALLPGLGPSMARRIVDFRETHRANAPGVTPVFRSTADLHRIPGLGERTLRRIAPHLLFPRREGSAHLSSME